MRQDCCSRPHPEDVRFMLPGRSTHPPRRCRRKIPFVCRFGNISIKIFSMISSLYFDYALIATDMGWLPTEMQIVAVREREVPRINPRVATY